MSALLHDVLRPSGANLDTLTDKLAKASLRRRNSGSDDDDDELVGVTSIPGTPAALSRPGSRPPSPTRQGARSRLAPGPLKLGARSSDPLKAFPTELSQRIFSQLTMRELASCSAVSRKWAKSQTLNYVWFQMYRRDTFHDDSMPQGKWTRRESKQNWRQTLMKALNKRADSPPPAYSSRRGSPPGSGYQTPKEVREERWKTENDATASPSKLEMREIYKSMDGRKARGKGKISNKTRDRGGWDNGGEDW
ncbi:hypothetical protein AURDEDRAFT_109569 [Auricularia subglabra TFB-10046 SS5]|nr:hypothetical protein AURDEDRAFT_109569 [Auricularia subglabra TFB-10046 SS5]